MAEKDGAIQREKPDKGRSVVPYRWILLGCLVHACSLCQLIHKIHILLQALQEALHNIRFSNKGVPLLRQLKACINPQPPTPSSPCVILSALSCKMEMLPMFAGRRRSQHGSPDISSAHGC